jgi:hypothetical protein
VVQGVDWSTLYALPPQAYLFFFPRHWRTLFFFLDLQLDLMKDTLNSLTETEVHPSIKSILAKSGELMQQYSNSQKVTSKK